MFSDAFWIAAIERRRSSAAGLPCSLTSRLVLSDNTPTRCAAIPALRAAIRAFRHRAGHFGRTFAQARRWSVDIFEDVGDRVLVLVVEQFGQALGQPLDAVDQFRRAVEQGAEPAGARRDHRATLRPHLGDRRRALDRAVELDFAEPVKPTALICAVVPWSTGVWSSTSIRTHTNSGRLGSSEIFWTWPTGTPEKVTLDPLSARRRPG